MMGCGASSAAEVAVEQVPEMADVLPPAVVAPASPALPAPAPAPAPSAEEDMLAQYGLGPAAASPKAKSPAVGVGDSEEEDSYDDAKKVAAARMARGAAHRTRFRRFSSERVC